MSSNGKYIPPHKRHATDQMPSKFEKFLQNHSSETKTFKSLTPWGTRDKRKGTIPYSLYCETELLFSKQCQNSNTNSYGEVPVKISEPFPEMLRFEDLGIDECLLNNIKRMGYSTPTPVQRFAIPVSLGRRDVMTCAQTGSGKTAAYLIPVIAKILSESPPISSKPGVSQPVSCILAPTRELCIQIYEEALKFSHLSGLQINAVYGGSDPKIQSIKLSKGTDIIVATPGRLIDMIGRGKIEMGLVKYLVIDEADLMFDMGFEIQIRNILENLKENLRETIMCSATFPIAIQDLAAQFMKDYVFLTIGKSVLTASNITQKLYYVEESNKLDELSKVLQKVSGRVLIFTQTKATANSLNEYLKKNGKNCDAIHGDKLQSERERALNHFKAYSDSILVATDVAARGIDISDVRYVINYDFPNNILDYTHRIGRTGRIGNKGCAISFLTHKDKRIYLDLYNILNECKQEVPDWLDEDLRY